MLENYSDEDAKYLMNFWKPKAGDRIIDLTTGDNHTINSLEIGYEEQAVCENGVIHLQDVEWIPDIESVLAIIDTQGGRSMPKYVRYGTCLFPRPNTVNEAINILRTIRQLEMNK